MAKTTECVDKLAPHQGCNEEEKDEEEFWPTPSLLTGHKIHTIRFGTGTGENESKILRYKSMSSEELTPLDMTYGTSDNDDPFRDDEFYDGTGNLMWMAAVCFGHLLFQEIEPLRSYLIHGSPPTKEGTKVPKNNCQRRFCELGCGTGGAGISLLLSSLDKTSNNNNNSANDCHVVFTDNDAESLELCASNCELNDIDPHTYSQRLLGWGSEHLEKAQQQEGENGGLEPYSFDVVFATDVIYDLKMIAPLFETVDFLLKEKKSHVILSHVPRFCIPKDDEDLVTNGEDDMKLDEDDSPGEPFLELEHFIRSQASKVGLVLVETIRPHQVLSEEGLGLQDCNDNDDEDSMQQLTLETMKEAHAVLFVFERFCNGDYGGPKYHRKLHADETKQGT